MDKQLEITIEKLVYGGDGMGRMPDGRAVFVPFVLPGEKVRIRIIDEKPRYLRALATEILMPSPLRITPRCKHFAQCGGCHYQHLSYPDQLSIKLDILKDQLTRIAGVINPPICGMTASPNFWHYRNNVQYHITREGQLGYKDISGSAILPVDECHLPQQEIDEVWQRIDLESESGISRLSLRQDSYDEIMLIFEGELDSPPEMELDMPVSACYITPDGTNYHMAGNDFLTYDILSESLTVSPESFFQVNTAQSANMVKFVLEEVEKLVNPQVLELYCGAGLFSLFLAPLASQLYAIESAPSSAYDFANNLDAFDNVSLYEGTVEDVLPGLDIHPDLVLLDPPRAGLAPTARDALISLAIPKVIYISCDPATLSRDLKSLISSGYQLDKIQAFDMFPQTYHVETVVILSKI